LPIIFDADGNFIWSDDSFFKFNSAGELGNMGSFYLDVAGLNDKKEKNDEDHVDHRRDLEAQINFGIGLPAMTAVSFHGQIIY
jgi:hypothetical protein